MSPNSFLLFFGAKEKKHIASIQKLAKKKLLNIVLFLYVNTLNTNKLIVILTSQVISMI